MSAHFNRKAETKVVTELKSWALLLVIGGEFRLVRKHF